MDLPSDHIAPTLRIAAEFYDSLSEEHLSCETSGGYGHGCPPLRTPHSIRGLVMGNAPGWS